MASGPYTIADMAKDALELADGLDIESFHLLGVSMGGAIAQEMALAAPDRVRTLTLAVTWPRSGAYARSLGEVWGGRTAGMTREQRVDELMLLTMSEGFYENRRPSPGCAARSSRTPTRSRSRRSRASSRQAAGTTRPTGSARFRCRST